LEQAELMEMMIPLLRADFRLVQTYEYLAEAPLQCPIIVYGGLQDRRVTCDMLSPWKEQTRTHLALSKDAPEPRAKQPPDWGVVIEIAEVGGLHHRYERRAA
jgi:hypothetical protein